MSRRSDWNIGAAELTDKEVSWRSVFAGRSHKWLTNENHQKRAKRAAEDLRETAAKEEAKNESKMGHDLAKGADRFEERSKSSDGKSAEEKQKG